MSDEGTTSGGEPPSAPAPNRRDYAGPVIALNAVGAGVSFLAFLAQPAGPNDALFLWILFVFTAPFAVGSLLAMWAVFGGKGSPWRLLAVVVPPALITLAAAPRFWEIGAGEWGGLLLCQIVVVSLAMLLLRLTGARVVRVEDSPPDGSHRWQFTLRSLFEWTVAVAVLSATFASLARHASPFFGVFFISLPAFFNVILALAALGIVLAAKEPGPWIVGLGMLVLLAAAVMSGLYDGEEASYAFVYWAWQSAWMIGSLRPFRRAGFRLMWRRAGTATTEADATVSAERDPWTDAPGRG